MRSVAVATISARFPELPRLKTKGRLRLATAGFKRAQRVDDGLRVIIGPTAEIA